MARGVAGAPLISSSEGVGGGAVGLFGQRAQQPVELGDQQRRGEGGTAATNRATAAFTVPITAIASPSANRHAASCASCGDGPDGSGAGSSTTDMRPTIKKGHDTLRRGPTGTTAPGAASPSQ